MPRKPSAVTLISFERGLQADKTYLSTEIKCQKGGQVCGRLNFSVWHLGEGGLELLNDSVDPWVVVVKS
jgi:hypothetical protein